MGLLSSKGRLGQVAENADLGGILRSAARTTLQSALAEGGNVARDVTTPSVGQRVRAALVKPAAVVAGGAAGVTAASAAVSAMRRKQGA